LLSTEKFIRISPSSRLGFDYRHLMDEKRRIGYTGPGLSK